MRLVDVDALRKELDNHWPFTKEEQSKHGFADMAKSTVLFVLNKMPIIEERKTARWRYSRNISSISYSDMMVTCEQCGYSKERQHGDVLNFCPNCGADMRGTDE